MLLIELFRLWGPVVIRNYHPYHQIIISSSQVVINMIIGSLIIDILMTIVTNSHPFVIIHHNFTVISIHPCFISVKSFMVVVLDRMTFFLFDYFFILIINFKIIFLSNFKL